MQLFIRLLCAILFSLFSFCYLYFLKGELLAHAQFVYSQGVTHYNLMAGALIITLLLQSLQMLVAWACRLPLRFRALSYVPSAIVLAILTDITPDALRQFSLGAWAWVAPILLAIFVFVVYLLREPKHSSTQTANDGRTVNNGERVTPFLILLPIVLFTGLVSHTSDEWVRELKTERLIANGDYAAAAQVGERALHASARHTRLRAYALSRQGELAERLFDAPQLYASVGLLDLGDTIAPYRVSTADICRHLGAQPGKSVRSASRYYELLLADTLWNSHTADYYLCALLLDKRLGEFVRHLPHFYPDSLPELPRAYREALLVAGDTLAVRSDTLLTLRFREYQDMKKAEKNDTVRSNITRRHFGQTYWWYYDFGGDARRRP